MRFKPPESNRAQALQAVRAAIEAVEASGGQAGQAGRAGRAEPIPDGGPEPVQTGWPPVDAAGGLARGAVHEWLEGDGGEWVTPRAAGGEGGKEAGEERHPEERKRSPAGGNFRPGTLPMGVAIHLARCAAGDGGEAGAVAWIGRRCWPHPRALVRSEVAGSGGAGGGADHGLLARSLFVDPPDRAARLWAIDLALRSSAVAAVVADGSGLDMASTRRLQLAARDAAGREGSGCGGGGFCLLLRPAADRKALSAAQTRWLVRPAPTDEGRCARWMIELLRRKGPAPAVSSGSGWQPLRLVLEWDHEAGAVIVAPEVVSRRLASKLQRAG